jgi:Rieske Fe-S protein
MIRYFKKIIQSVLFFMLLLPVMNGCNDDYVSVVPYVPVDVNINPVNLIELNTPGGSAYLQNNGFGGIIVFRDMTDSSNPFLAYDATCTYEIKKSCRVVADGSGLATCACCGSQYILFGGNGSPTKGPAIEPLKQYRTSYINGRIIIRN